jgi:3-oxoacyl-(acyl-carrier-protein) synthase
LLKAVHFAGPKTVEISLATLGGDEAGKIPKIQSSCDLAAAPGTILLFRPDVYEYSCQSPTDDTMMLVAHFLTPPDKFTDAVLDGDTSWISPEGPPVPPGVRQRGVTHKGEHVYVMNNVARLPARWDNQWAYFAALSTGCDGVIKIPVMRWDVDIYKAPDPDIIQDWQTATWHQSFCEGAEFFDNRHFEISNAEGGGIDPVMRLTLECGAQSLALHGITKKMTNRRAFHAGFCAGNDKLDWATLPKETAVGGALGGTSMNLAILANRFNFTFNLKGPSFVCDTACSASLTSTHCARRCVLEVEFDPLEFFITMGSHLCLASGPFIGGSQSHMNSFIGRCFTFNASADGYLRGEGIVGFMMKYGTQDELHDKSDCILRATMLGQDGRSASLTAPNGPAQEEMIRRAIKEAQMVAPESTVWECHGTGTTLGDPIEVGAIRKVQIRMKRLEPLMITSVKSNMGHLEGSAAMGGMVKCILQCKRTKCCPTLHVRTLNPHLEHAAFEAIFQTEAALYTYFQGHSQVSSFGFGGANGHGIFWGRNLEAQPNIKTLWAKKLESRPPPQVRVMGRDPNEWEADFPDMRTCKNGAKFTTTFGPDTPEDEAIVWKLVEDGPEQDEEDEETFYAITGNFNEWQDDRMASGDVNGSFSSIVEVPESGVLEFRILKDSDTAQVIAPAIPNCTKKTAKIEGPKEGLTNSWSISADAGQEVEVIFFAKKGMMSILWVTSRQSFE